MVAPDPAAGDDDATGNAHGSRAADRTGARSGNDAHADVSPLLRWVDADECPRSEPYPCPYLPGRMARQRGFRVAGMPGELYHELMDRGFRRSGDVFYAMVCDDCRLCVPIRVPVATFAPSKSQRRALRRNEDVTVQVGPPTFTPEKFALYRRYLAGQHGRGETAGDGSDSTNGGEREDEFRASMYGAVVDTVEVTYTLGDRLLATSLLDVCARSVSAVYHFYDPDEGARSLGVFSVLMEIEYTRQLGVPHYYLGYWIEGAKTMQYKANYRPHELLRSGRWQPAN
ncbi:MAG: arginyltransferase [Planctomycetota bacterium]|jgi:arginyl-tRNA--protein-N-Asp/Glu arginylyltransferase